VPQVYRRPLTNFAQNRDRPRPAGRTGDQESGSREKTSLSRRSPVESPAFASSPTISAAAEISSAPPGGATAPSVSPSLSNPWRGAGSCSGAFGRGGAGRFAARARFARTALDGRGVAGDAFAAAAAEDSVTASTARFSVARGFGWDFERAAVRLFAVGFAGLARVVLRGAAGSALASRAAARRALERCGRVRGRFASTPPSLRGVFVALLLTSASAMCTSLLKVAAGTLPGSLQASRQTIEVDRGDALAWVPEQKRDL
jgi:hypothetical protein